MSPFKMLRVRDRAYLTDDHERNRQFYEDVLGMPLVAMRIERTHLQGEWVEFGRAFYRMADGSALAFFKLIAAAKHAAWKAKEQSLFVHIPLMVDQSVQDDVERRLIAADRTVFVLDHGFRRSLYVNDPNGLLLEFTVDHEDAAGIDAEIATTVRVDRPCWMAEDKNTNGRQRSTTPANAADWSAQR